ncbi:pyridoxine 5'-phosphate synthase [Balneola vulgaris]|uniref:pyridoxine 5'-phosphate synthase n=1 Tax=Balneola vulgaris TaxID=287535 RepID=UPI00037CE4D3|nr:pyridoxine 5'-phosphate synthase [Balneola vulgaris]
MRLLVNIDHVATLRNARGEGYPNPVDAAKICEQHGASGIVFHLRGDRRHIKDEDVFALKDAVTGTLDFEMAATDEMIQILAKVQPHLCTLVPEGRLELTTEGGLNMKAVFEDFKSRVFPAIRKHPIEISLFLDPNPEDIELAHQLGTDAIELHTGNYANAADDTLRKAELDRLAKAAELAHGFGIKVNGGHGLNQQNLKPFIDAVPHLNEVSIGHALISDAIFDGLGKTVENYIKIIER